MTVVRAVEPAIDDIVVMVVVWNPGMAAVLTMFMVAQLGRAPLWVGLRHGDLVVVDVVDVEVMHMSVVEIIHVRGVTNGEMSAIRRVLVAMFPMRVVRHIRAADQHAAASKQHQKQHSYRLCLEQASFSRTYSTAGLCAVQRSSFPSYKTDAETGTTDRSMPVYRVQVSGER